MIEAQNSARIPQNAVVHDGIFGALVLRRDADTRDERDRIYGICPPLSS